ncbi:MAG TPA: cupredoxin domain-containing protein [Candidatus Paceibacterota bacterium]|nr:cupredoxin domain-containing protein [Candidatus Paceibacterota bacterium]
METAVKIIITVLFIALIAISIVFFGVFGILPLRKIKVFIDRPVATSTIPVQEEVEIPPTPVAPGTSPVTAEGEVITDSGNPVRLDVTPGTPEAPQQSNPISREILPESAIQIEVSDQGFSPTTFTVKAGEAVTLSLTSVGSQTHVFKFENPSLKAVAIGVGPEETRAITFNAPTAGSYAFYCDVPGHRSRGEEGVMMVE